MTAFVELLDAQCAESLAGLSYRRSLAVLQKLQVRDEALQSPVGRLALSWAAQYPPWHRIEARALRAIAVQGDMRAGRIDMRGAELLAYGADKPTAVSLDMLSERVTATAKPAFVGAASDPEAAAGRAIELLEDVLGPCAGLARPHLLPLWADAYRTPRCRESFVRPSGEKGVSVLSEYRVKAAKEVWSREVRPAPPQQQEAACALAVGTHTTRGWLVLLANRDPLGSITSREAGMWGRLAWLCDPRASAGRAAVERARRDAQGHWRERLERGLVHDDPYVAMCYALGIAA